jgi:Helix-turn-helix of insertion element transposase
MQGHGEKLTRKQEQAIAALLSETTIPAAAERIGLNEATLYRWLKVDDFKSAFRAARREVVEKATAQLQQAAWAASTTLIKLLGSPSDSIRLRAATSILDHANKGVEMLDFEERLAALERQAEEEKDERGQKGRR